LKLVLGASGCYTCPMSFKKYISLILVIVFSFSTCPNQGLAWANEAIFLPIPGQKVLPSRPSTPIMLKGIKIDPKNSLQFDFILSTLSSPNALIGDPHQEQLKTDANRLIKYFLANLAIPEGDLWVNLSPYEKDHMIPDSLGKTELGRDLLAQDYVLKQLTASLLDPQTPTGKEFWQKIYTKAQQQYGTTNIPVNTYNKVWVLADQARIFQKNNAAYVLDAHMKVMTDTDYLAENKNRTIVNNVSLRAQRSNLLNAQILKDLILPEIEKEVNTGEHFASLRQMYHAFILASWYKKNLKQSILNQFYANKKKVNNLSVIPAQAGIHVMDPPYIYRQYLKAFKKGVVNLIQEDQDPITHQLTPRKYFSGGTEFHSDHAQPVAEGDLTVNDKASIAQSNMVVTAEIDAAMNASSTEDVKAMFPESPEKVKRIWNGQEVAVWGNNATINTFVHLLELANEEGEQLEAAENPAWHMLYNKLESIQIDAIFNGAKQSGRFDLIDLDKMRDALTRRSRKDLGKYLNELKGVKAQEQYEEFFKYITNITSSLQTYGMRERKRYGFDMTNLFFVQLLGFFAEDGMFSNEINDEAYKARLRILCKEAGIAIVLVQKIGRFWTNIKENKIRRMIGDYVEIAYYTPAYAKQLLDTLEVLRKGNPIIDAFLLDEDKQPSQGVGRPNHITHGRLTHFNLDPLFEYDLVKAVRIGDSAPDHAMTIDERAQAIADKRTINSQSLGSQEILPTTPSLAQLRQSVALRYIERFTGMTPLLNDLFVHLGSKEHDGIRAAIDRLSDNEVEEQCRNILQQRLPGEFVFRPTYASSDLSQYISHYRLNRDDASYGEDAKEMYLIFRYLFIVSKKDHVFVGNPQERDALVQYLLSKQGRGALYVPGSGQLEPFRFMAQQNMLRFLRLADFFVDQLTGVDYYNRPFEQDTPTLATLMEKSPQVRKSVENFLSILEQLKENPEWRNFLEAQEHFEGGDLLRIQRDAYQHKISLLRKLVTIIHLKPAEKIGDSAPNQAMTSPSLIIPLKDFSKPAPYNYKNIPQDRVYALTWKRNPQQYVTDALMRVSLQPVQSQIRDALDLRRPNNVLLDGASARSLTSGTMSTMMGFINSNLDKSLGKDFLKGKDVLFIGPGQHWEDAQELLKRVEEVRSITIMDIDGSNLSMSNPYMVGAIGSVPKHLRHKITLIRASILQLPALIEDLAFDVVYANNVLNNQVFHLETEYAAAVSAIHSLMKKNGILAVDWSSVGKFEGFNQLKGGSISRIFRKADTAMIGDSKIRDSASDAAMIIDEHPQTAATSYPEAPFSVSSGIAVMASAMHLRSRARQLAQEGVIIPPEGKGWHIVLIGPGRNAKDLEKLLAAYPQARQIDIIDPNNIDKAVENVISGFKGAQLPIINIHRKNILAMSGVISNADVVMAFHVFDKNELGEEAIKSVRPIIWNMLNKRGIFLFNSSNYSDADHWWPYSHELFKHGFKILKFVDEREQTTFKVGAVKQDDPERIYEPKDMFPDTAMTVLVVEDNRKTLAQLEDKFRNFGYHVLTAESGNNAFTELERQTVLGNYVDLVMTDITMPDGHGEDFLERLSNDSQFKNIPAIVLSNNPIDEAGFKKHFPNVTSVHIKSQEAKFDSYIQQFLKEHSVAFLTNMDKSIDRITSGKYTPSQGYVIGLGKIVAIFNDTKDSLLRTAAAAVILSHRQAFIPYLDQANDALIQWMHGYAPEFVNDPVNRFILSRVHTHRLNSTVWNDFAGQELKRFTDRAMIQRRVVSLPEAPFHASTGNGYGIEVIIHKLNQRLQQLAQEGFVLPARGRGLHVVLIGPGSDAGDLEMLERQLPEISQIDIIDPNDIGGEIPFRRVNHSTEVVFHQKNILEMGEEVQNADMVIAHNVFDVEEIGRPAMEEARKVIWKMLKPKGIFLFNVSQQDETGAVDGFYPFHWVTKGFKVLQFKYEQQDYSYKAGAIKQPDMEHDNPPVAVFPDSAATTDTAMNSQDLQIDDLTFGGLIDRRYTEVMVAKDGVGMGIGDLESKIGALHAGSPLTDVQKIIDELWELRDKYTLRQFGHQESGSLINDKAFELIVRQLQVVWEKEGFDHSFGNLYYWIIESALRFAIDPGVLVGRSCALMQLSLKNDLPHAHQINQLMVNSLSSHLRLITDHPLERDHLTQQDIFVDPEILLPHLLIVIERYLKRSANKELVIDDDFVLSAMGLDPNIFPSPQPSIRDYRKLMINHLLVLNKKYPGKVTQLYTRILSLDSKNKWNAAGFNRPWKIYHSARARGIIVEDTLLNNLRVGGKELERRADDDPQDLFTEVLKEELKTLIQSDEPPADLAMTSSAERFSVITRKIKEYMNSPVHDEKSFNEVLEMINSGSMALGLPNVEKEKIVEFIKEQIGRYRFEYRLETRRFIAEDTKDYRFQPFYLMMAASIYFIQELTTAKNFNEEAMFQEFQELIDQYNQYQQAGIPYTFATLDIPMAIHLALAGYTKYEDILAELSMGFTHLKTSKLKDTMAALDLMLLGVHFQFEIRHQKKGESDGIDIDTIAGTLAYIEQRLNDSSTPKEVVASFEMAIGKLFYSLSLHQEDIQEDIKSKFQHVIMPFAQRLGIERINKILEHIKDNDLKSQVPLMGVREEVNTIFAFFYTAAHHPTEALINFWSATSQQELVQFGQHRAAISNGSWRVLLPNEIQTRYKLAIAFWRRTLKKSDKAMITDAEMRAWIDDLNRQVNMTPELNAFNYFLNLAGVRPLSNMRAPYDMDRVRPYILSLKDTLNEYRHWHQQGKDLEEIKQQARALISGDERIANEYVVNLAYAVFSDSFTQKEKAALDHFTDAVFAMVEKSGLTSLAHVDNPYTRLAHETAIANMRLKFRSLLILKETRLVNKLRALVHSVELPTGSLFMYPYSKNDNNLVAKIRDGFKAMGEIQETLRMIQASITHGPPEIKKTPDLSTESKAQRYIREFTESTQLLSEAGISEEIDRFFARIQEISAAFDRQVESDAAMNVKAKGGVAFKAKDLQMNIESSGTVDEFAIDPAILTQFQSPNFIGVKATIIRMTPINGAAQLLGLEI